MTAVPSSFSPFYPEGIGSQLTPGATIPLQASAVAIGYGQLATFDASGNAALNDGTVPGLIAAGVGLDKLSDTSTIAGLAKSRAWWGMGYMPFSSGAADGFSAADIGGVPAFIADENTLGRKSNVSGSNRSLAGMVFGVSDDATLARFWGGPMAVAVARAILIANACPLAWYTITDAAASTATTERAIPRAKVKGTVTRIEFVGAAVSADASNTATMTLSARDGAGGAARTLGTWNTTTGQNGAITSLVPAVFTLGSAADLYLLETDIVTLTVTKANSGQQLIGEILVNGKAL